MKMKNLNRNLRKQLVSMLIFTLIVGSVFAQTTKITGKITDEKGEPLLGVTVVIKETSKGAISDLNGYFAIEANNNDILIFSMIGYTTEEVRLNGNRFLNIVLKEKVTELQNIVVIGYGTSAKKDLTGAVSVIKGDELSKMPVGSVANILQGKTPGVSVSSSSGTPGAPAVIRIRGISSINGSNTPLYIVDGLPQNNIDYLNPSDIETVVVHKDASVAAIYGARGANGIIMITTKSGGSKEKINVNYDSYVGIQAPWKRPYMLSAREFIEYKNLSYANAGLPTLTEFSTPENIASVMNFVTKNSGPKGTDWWKEITNYQALLQNHNISISGGSKKVNILSSLAYLTEEGIVKGSEYQRLSWRNNLNAEISDRIKFTAIFGIVNENRKVIDENNPATGTIFSAMTADPITPVFRNNLVDVPLFYNNIYNGYDRSNIYSHYAGIMYSNKRNPVAQIERMRQSKYGTFSLKSGGNLEIILIDALKFNSRFGLDMAMGQTEGFQPYYTISPSDYSSTNTVISNSSTTRYIVFENTLNYDKKIGEYKFGALIGTSAESTHSSSVNASIQGIVNNNPEMRILNAGTINPSVSGYPYSNALLSYFGRLTADYRNKYLLAFNLRRDGSSRFAKENRWGTFPSVSAAWRFSSENFMQPYSSWLSDAKLRISYGHIGNENIGGGAYLSTYGTSIYDRYVLGNPSTAVIGAGRQLVGNKNLQWETSKQFDIGLDVNLFNGKIEVAVDYFNKRIENMLMMVPLNTTLGFPNSPYTNAGSMENKGWELSISHYQREGQFQYSISGNVSAYRNKVLSIGNGDAIYGSTYLTDFHLTKTEVGLPVGYFYGYVTNGIFQNSQQVEDGPQRYVSTPGDVRYKDLVADDIINEEDRTIIGNPWPDFVYGITFNCSYKNFDFSTFLQGSQGNDVLNIKMYDIESGNGYLNAPKGFLGRAWNGEGSTDRFHKISQNQGLNNLISDYFIEDGSYLRIKNLQIGYDLKGELPNIRGINQLRLYISIQNLLTLTRYSGLDPEIGSTDPKLTGIDQGFYPQSRIYTIGLNIKL